MKTTRRGFLAAAVATLTTSTTQPMATNTPTFDFDREDPGADGWTDRINGNFTDIESLLTGSAVNGAKPTLASEDVDTEEFNNTVYASNSLSEFPSIQDGLDRLSSTATGERELIIVGGENTLSSRLVVTGRGFRDAIDGASRISIRTAPGSWLKIDSAASFTNNNPILIGGTIGDYQFNVDANTRNGAQADPAILVSGNRSSTSLTAQIYDATTGATIQSNSERMRVRVYAEQCGTGLLETQAESSSGGNTGMNDIVLQGRDNGIDMEVNGDSADAQSFRSHPRIYTESHTTAGLKVTDNVDVTAFGTIRIGPNPAVVENDAKLRTMGMWLSGDGTAGSASVSVEGGEYIGVATSYGNADVGVEAGTTTAVGRCHLAYPNFYNIANTDFDAAEVSNGSIRHPVQLSGTTFVKAGDSGNATSGVVSIEAMNILSGASIDVQQGRAPILYRDTPTDAGRGNLPATEGSFLPYNTDSSEPEYYDGTDWRSVIDGSIT